MHIPVEIVWIGPKQTKRPNRQRFRILCRYENYIMVESCGRPQDHPEVYGLKQISAIEFPDGITLSVNGHYDTTGA